jgi:RNA polymerase sigma-70 factor (ECF subfamily)
VKQGPSDLQLLHRARWDPEAFRVFYQRHAEPLTTWLEREAGSRDVALEIAAETFARALVNAGRFRGEAEHGAGPWLYGVAADLLRRHWAGLAIDTRARRRLGVLEETRFRYEAPAPVGVPPSAARIAMRLEAALDRVPIAYRDAVKVRVLGRGACGEAGGLPTRLGAARVRALRALGLGVRYSRWL